MTDRVDAPQRFAGLVLAAGRSRRMGALKQTLPWPTDRGATVVSSAFDAIAPFCACMWVVVGTDAPAVLAALPGRTLVRIDADSDQEMLASVCAGLSAIAAMPAGDSFDAVFIQPGDHPGVARTTIEALIAAVNQDRAAAVLPEHRGKGGHPALVPLPVAAQILRWAAHAAGNGLRSGGLRQFWLEHPDRRRRLAVDDGLCTLDLDTPEDYRAAIAAIEPHSGGL